MQARRGRPIKPAAGTKRVQLNILVRADLKRMIVRAAQRSKHTLSAEAELWLERLLVYERMGKAFDSLRSDKVPGGLREAVDSLRLGKVPGGLRETFDSLRSGKGPGEQLRETFDSLRSGKGPGEQLRETFPRVFGPEDNESSSHERSSAAARQEQLAPEIRSQPRRHR